MSNIKQIVYKRSAIENNKSTPWCLDLFNELVVPSLKEKQYKEEIINMMIEEYKGFLLALTNMKKTKEINDGFALESDNIKYTTIVIDGTIYEFFAAKGCPTINIEYSLFDFVKEEFEDEDENDDIIISFYKLDIYF